MATRDYVKRGKRPRKPVARRKAPSSNNSFMKMKLLLVLVFFILGLVYILKSAFNQEPNNTETALPEQSQPVKNVKSPEIDTLLPPKPTEKWSYIETLENKKVQVEANDQIVSSRPYLMQCGAYRDQIYAEARKAKIAFQGYESQIRITATEKSTWYRVILGPYDLKRKAESDRNHLRRAGIEPCKIWHWED